MEINERVLKVGDLVIFIDEHRQFHNALVTIWHGSKDGDTIGGYREKWTAADAIPCINLVFTTGSEDKTDPYGRQIERKTSVGHGSKQTPANLGNCFIWPDEV